MRLVGASNWFVQGPFVIEGILDGLIAATLTFGLFFGVALLARDPIAHFLPGVDLLVYYRIDWLELFGFTAILGVGTGVISSAIAIRRYLRV